MITADFAIVPIGSKDTECKEFVKNAVQVIKDSGLTYQLTGMSTLIEAEDYKQLYDVLAKAQEAVFQAGTDRVYSIIKIDDRRDKDNRTLDVKVETVNEILE
ncbi:MAG TPA: MTH1187 family thiamine-binding protein [Methanosphaera sp.]|nr:MTH1187 family thiamine-binding protein [Methanosphaera sp.]